MRFGALVKSLLEDGLDSNLCQMRVVSAQKKTESKVTPSMAIHPIHATPKNVLLCTAVADIGMMVTMKG